MRQRGKPFGLSGFLIAISVHGRRILSDIGVVISMSDVYQGRRTIVRLRIADAKALGAGNIEPFSADGANDIVKITPVVHVRPNNVSMLCIRVVDMQVHCLHSDGVNHCLP